ncbi:hypothetical protein QM012_000315 [Aureobasidium pullulans]|uniref:Aminoglycoside phosphotransferase domain-containing protein n=1 Tax=Aureobasidium pullulans TaxID=5580 RepID=A0ABR0TVS6_AURPU
MDNDELNTTHEERMQAWLDHYNRFYGPGGVEKLASKYRDGQHCECLGRINGGFNICFKVLFDDGVAWAVRYPVPGWVMDPDEKVRREVAVLRFLQEKTQIPIPRLIAYGSASENHDSEIGPFVISEWVDGKSLNSMLEELPRPEWGPVLRDDIDDDIFYKIYIQIAEILLELASHRFDKIGSLSIQDGNDKMAPGPVCMRPLTRKMNEIQRGSYVVVDDCRAPPLNSVADYMNHLLQQNMTHLYKQRNSVDDKEDARNKFILRRRLQALVPYFTSRFDSGPFTLFCDDFHPRNILVDENTYQITAVIDWEWTNTAPFDFSMTPPSWLVLEPPESWIASSEIKFKKQLTLFLRALEDAESRREQCVALTQPNAPRMSSAMRQSFDDGTFWFVQLSMESFSFDGDVFWPHLESILQERGLLEIGIPDEGEIQQFVAHKMKDLEAYNRELEEKKNKQHAGTEVDWVDQSTAHTDDDAAVAEPEDVQHKNLGMNPTSQPSNQANTSTHDRADIEATASESRSRNTSSADSHRVEQTTISADDHTDDAAADPAESLPHAADN